MEERLRVLLLNAMGLYADRHSDSYNTRAEFTEMYLGELGTDSDELKELGIELSEIFGEEAV